MLLGVTIIVALAGVFASGAAARLVARPGTRLVRLDLEQAVGAPGRVVVALPSWYSPERNPSLPLVISPAGRGGTALGNARRFGDLPGRLGFVVLSADLPGRLFLRRAWAAPTEIAELSRLPELVARALPYLRFDPDRIYAAGDSMGGQEALILLARRPDLLAAVVAADPVTDFLLRWYAFPFSENSRGDQELATREVGATPDAAPWLYLRRSPDQFAPTIAFAGVPARIWWSTADEVVIGQAMEQAGPFVRRLRRLNPRAPVSQVVTHGRHGQSFFAANRLPAMMRFLLSHRRHDPPAAGFSYVSWLPSATVWGWRFQAGSVRHGFWRVDGVRASGFATSSPVELLVRPPDMPGRAFVDGRRVAAMGGTVVVPAGHHVVRLVL